MIDTREGIQDMEKWEYFTTFIEASVKKETKDYLKERFPDKKNLPKYTPESMMPELDKLGDEGWELVHMEPVAKVGGNGDILFEGAPKWSNHYFCVFKRQKRQLSRPLPVQPAPQPPTPSSTPPTPATGTSTGK
jgi:hypothetical protein